MNPTELTEYTNRVMAYLAVHPSRTPTLDVIMAHVPTHRRLTHILTAPPADDTLGEALDTHL